MNVCQIGPKDLLLGWRNVTLHKEANLPGQKNLEKQKEKDIFPDQKSAELFHVI